MGFFFERFMRTNTIAIFKKLNQKNLLFCDDIFNNHHNNNINIKNPVHEFSLWHFIATLYGQFAFDIRIRTMLFIRRWYQFSGKAHWNYMYICLYE